ncbi:MAG: hypothetical protein IKY44_06495 [Clostridia bacterium]|nr:hypothetical protein [Clostridia bacterium]
MFDYAILQIVFALFLMSIPLGFATAIGWCDPDSHRKRPAVFTVSLIFALFGVFALIKLTGICFDHLTPGQNLLDSATGLFNAIYEITVDSDMVRYAADQIHALVFSGVAIVFALMAFLLSIFFWYVLVFRIALLVDKKLKNSTRYGVMAVCLIVTVLLGVITSQYAFMGLAIAYVVLSVAFLAFGNWRLVRAGGSNDESEDKPRRRAKSAPQPTEAEEMEQEAREFFGNTDSFKI